MDRGIWPGTQIEKDFASIVCGVLVGAEGFIVSARVFCSSHRGTGGPRTI